MRTPRSIKEANVVKPKRFRVLGGGRKTKNDVLEEKLYQWIVERRDAKKQVSRKSIQEKAMQIFGNMENVTTFAASNGWCQNFMRRFNLSTRQKTNQSQRLPDELTSKLVAFFQYLRHYFANNPNVKNDQLTAMDETCVFLENVSNRTISITGKICK